MTVQSLLHCRYELGPVLGRGGMGVVHRGRDRLLERDVAIKLLLDGDADEARFIAEAKRTAGLAHPGIVAVFDTGRSEGQTFMVMELLVGETLEDRLRREGALPLAEVLRIGAEICDALALAHEHGVVHRDIKPANVFLAQRGSDGPATVKVVDFGIAKKLGDAQHTDPGTMVGSYATMSPEQVRGEELDGRADLYSLGVVLYRAATGTPPFAATNAAGLVLAHMNEPAPRLRLPHADAALRARLDAVLQRLLAKDRAARPSSASAAKKLLLEDQPTEHAAPAPLTEIPDLALAAPSRAPTEHAAPILSLMQIETAERSEVAPDPAVRIEPAPIASFDVDTRPAPLLVTAHAARLRADAAAPPPPPPPSGLLGISPDVSKRIALYSGLLLAVLLLFFRVHWLMVCTLGAATLFGVASYLTVTTRAR